MPRLRLQLLLLVLSALSACAAPATAADFMFQGTVDGETFEGRPLAWTDYVMHLLGRDGRLLSFDPHAVKNAKRTSPNFVGYSQQEMKRTLYREFGDAMDITTTQHYIVVHPHGDRSDWASLFEKLYRSFRAYFRVRGFELEDPKYPLVAVVFRNRDEFSRAAANVLGDLPPGSPGYYSSDSNRVQLFDVTTENGADWTANADLIVHEATHQTAFNVGIHNRFAEQPKWIKEGLATMFEAPGVWNSQSFHSLSDRINKGQLAAFRACLAKRKPGTLGNLVASDQLYKTDPTAFYAEAWALTFYLCETRPRELAEYFKKTAARDDFSNYFATQRVNDFAECFGSDFKQLEANFLSWMADLK
jgi:Protein of unknown function (DUF1570)